MTFNYGFPKFHKCTVVLLMAGIITMLFTASLTHLVLRILGAVFCFVMIYFTFKKIRIEVTEDFLVLPDTNSVFFKILKIKTNDIKSIKEINKRFLLFAINGNEEIMIESEHFKNSEDYLKFKKSLQVEIIEERFKRTNKEILKLWLYILSFEIVISLSLWIFDFKISSIILAIEFLLIDISLLLAEMYERIIKKDPG